MEYTCGVCELKIAGDLVTLKEHTDKHVIDLIKHDHPDWAEEDGACEKCVEYYRSEINGSTFKDAPCAIRKRKVNKVTKFFKGLFKN